jgi:outer membrane protein with beta-barrel domain
MKKCIFNSKYGLLLIAMSFCCGQVTYGQTTRKATARTESSYMAMESDNDNEAEEDTTAAAAQNGHSRIVFGVEAGVNLSNYYFKHDLYSWSNDMIVGGRAGGIVDIALSNQLYFQPGLFYAMNGTKATYRVVQTKSHETININTIELPANILYKTGKPDAGRFFVGLGPYVGYNVSGTITNTSSDLSKGTVHIGSNKDNDDIKPLDFGVGATAGYELACGFFVRLRYEIGLFNLTPNTNAGASIKSTSYGINVGYLFKKHCCTKSTKTTGSAVEN